MSACMDAFKMSKGLALREMFGYGIWFGSVWMSGRSMKGTKTYGGSGTSHSTTTGYGVSKRGLNLKFFPMKGKFTSEQEVNEYLSGDTIQCLECGREKKSLGKHLPSHGLNVDSYKMKFGIPKGKALMTNTCREVRANVARQINSSLTPEQMKEKLDRMRALPRKHHDHENDPAFIKKKRIEVGRNNKGRSFKIAVEQANCPECGMLCHVAVNVKKRGNFLCERCGEKHYYESQKKYADADPDRKHRNALARAAYAKRKGKTPTHPAKE